MKHRRRQNKQGGTVTTPCQAYPQPKFRSRKHFLFPQSLVIISFPGDGLAIGDLHLPTATHVQNMGRSTVPYHHRENGGGHSVSIKQREIGLAHIETGEKWLDVKTERLNWSLHRKESKEQSLIMFSPCIIGCAFFPISN